MIAGAQTKFILAVLATVLIVHVFMKPVDAQSNYVNCSNNERNCKMCCKSLQGSDWQPKLVYSSGGNFCKCTKGKRIEIPDGMEMAQSHKLPMLPKLI